MLGLAGCRQLLGIDPGTVQGDAGASDALADSSAPDTTIDARPDAPLDASARVWSDPELVVGLASGDEDPTLTGDLLEMYFTRNNDVFYTTRTNTTALWGPPHVASFQMGGTDEAPELTADGLILQFASNRGAGGTLDVYFTSRASRAADWGPPVALDSLNSSTSDDLPGSATTDLSRVTLASDRNGGGTGLDLYESTRIGNAGISYTAPALIPLSTVGTDASPFLSADGLALYYAMSPANDPNRDLYVATRASTTDPFSGGTRIDELSTTFNDSDPWVSPDGNDIYFTSTRNGTTRIWHARKL